jgi:uncharacterized protein (TIGR02001 family)
VHFAQQSRTIGHCTNSAKDNNMKKLILISAILAALNVSVAFAEDKVPEPADQADMAANTAEDAAKSMAEPAAETMSEAPATEMAEAPADDAPASPWVGNITFVSDYRFRGISQTQADPALQIGLNYNHESGVYAGVWASNARFIPPAVVGYEFDTLIGWAGKLNDDVGVDLQLIRYNYPVDAPEADYAELIGKVTYAGFSGTIGYSNDVFNQNETGIYYALGYGTTVAENYTLSASVGYYDLTDPATIGGSIVDYSLGISRSFGPLTVGLSYVDTNNGAEGFFGNTNDGRMVFSMGSAF